MSRWAGGEPYGEGAERWAGWYIPSTKIAAGLAAVSGGCWNWARFQSPSGAAGAPEMTLTGYQGTIPLSASEDWQYDECSRSIELFFRMPGLHPRLSAGHDAAPGREAESNRKRGVSTPRIVH